MTNKNGPKVLLLDIETSPILAHVWALFDQNVALNQIEREWFVLSWSAKWLGDPPSKIMYMDQRRAKDIENDSRILKEIWALLDDADIVITQNGKKFDIKKLNARFMAHGFQPPSSFKQIDTLVIAKKYFAFTSNKLEWMTGKFCKKHKKSQHKKYPGFMLWSECLKGNIEAWKEMEKYNKADVTSLEELYYKLIPWDSSLNFNLYHEGTENTCKCGSTKFIKKGFHYTSTGRYQRFRCTGCGAETKGRLNTFTKAKRQSLRTGTIR